MAKTNLMVETVVGLRLCTIIALNAFAMVLIEFNIPEVRKIVKIRTVRKRDVFLPECRIFQTLKIEEKQARKGFRTLCAS